MFAPLLTYRMLISIFHFLYQFYGAPVGKRQSNHDDTSMDHRIESYLPLSLTLHHKPTFQVYLKSLCLLTFYHLQHKEAMHPCFCQEDFFSPLVFWGTILILIMRNSIYASLDFSEVNFFTFDGNICRFL